ncbi:hypothetical protein ATZ36_05380 [Candidatus Endomicrobiellum trichonymphae]|uniref:Replication-associated protein ORF2/G2P domain-containing protein n=1 Tax=Endomicrobium trichonymphae TaxID=1408204 RepID=A0A1E5IIB2_ENDTX|nr:hypothetical protein ATZ36_05380 [Candidatus Endomicrobium trichonymphae]
MLCSNPYILTTKQDKKTGKRIELNSPLTLPCGKCDLCLSARAKKWAEQCMLEAKLTDAQTHCNLFITLTYADEFLPKNNSLCETDLTQYLDKLHNLNVNKKQKIRFFAAGEYGDKTHRPHYHLILFNVPRLWITKSWQKSGKQYLSVLSPLLTDIWNKGEIADINLIGRGYDNDDSSCYAIKYASQSHQKGGVSYYNFTEKIEVDDGRWIDVKQPENAPDLVKVVEAQLKGNKKKWIDNLGRVRPFRRMSRGLGLPAAMRLKPVSEPVLLGSDGMLYKRRSKRDIIGVPLPSAKAVYNVPVPVQTPFDKFRYYYDFEDSTGKQFKNPEHNNKFIPSGSVTANKYLRQKIALDGLKKPKEIKNKKKATAKELAQNLLQTIKYEHCLKQVGINGNLS